MRKSLPLALVAGAASGLLMVGTSSGQPLALLLSHFTLLPLFLAGLGIGTVGALAAGGTGALTVGILAGPLPALVYGALNALPVLILVRQAQLSRAASVGGLEWYPGGLLLCWLVGIAMGFYALALAFFAVFGNGLIAATSDVLRLYTEALGDAIAPSAAEVVLGAAPLVPALTAGFYILNATLNAALAQHLLRRSGRNLRPSVDFAALTLPPQLLWLALASLLLGLIAPPLAPIAYTLAFIVAVAYFLLGLAVVHAFLRRRTKRGAAMFGFYAAFALSMVLFSAIGAAVVGLGVAEQLAGLRRRFTGGRKEDG
jgi:hypothetical protein